MLNSHLSVVPDGFKVARATADDIRLRWPLLRKWLLEIGRKNPKSYAKWEPEHIRLEVLKGIAGQNGVQMFLCFNPDLQGFFITYPQVDPFVNLPLALFIWLTYGPNGVLEYAMPFIEQMAREGGYTAIEGMSGRPGWIRRLARYGFEPTQVVLRKNLLDEED